MDGLEGSRREVAACRCMREFALSMLVMVVLALGVTSTSALAALETTIDSGPAGPTNDPTPTFTFSSTDPNAIAFDCAVDGDTFPSCSSPFMAPPLAEGSHTFSVTPSDGGGNVGAPQVRSFVVDITRPVATIDSGPPAFTNSTSATFTFSGTDDVSPSDKLALQCRLSFQPLEPCPSPKEYTALPEGQYTFRVRATDEAGNVGGAAIYAWTVDVTPPDTTIDTGPPNPTNPMARFTFSSDDPSAAFECNVDAQEFVPCSSPWVSDPLSDGSHTFEVRATDLAGNVDASPAIIAFTVDTTPPPPVTDTPPSSSSPPSPQPSADGPNTTSTAPAIVATSFVLIAKRPIMVTRRRFAPITLNCAGSEDCAGAVRLTTARPVRASSARSQEPLSRKRWHGRDRRQRRARRRAIRRVMRLGSARFVIPARKTTQVKVRLSEKSYRLVKKLRRAKVLVTVRHRDRAGHIRIGTREIFLTVR
jgi:hypothetical protein